MKKNKKQNVDTSNKIFNASDRFIAYAMYGVALFLVVFASILAADPAWLSTLNKVDKHHEVKKTVILGKQYADSGEYDKAAFILSKALETIPDMLEAKTLLADVYKKAGYPGKAIEIYRDVILTDSSHYYLFALHNLYLLQGDSVLAEEFFNRSVAANPLIIDRLMKLGRYYIVNEDWEKAAETFDSVIVCRYDIKTYYSDMTARAGADLVKDERITDKSESVSKSTIDDDLMSLYSEDIFKINLSRDLSLAKTLNKVGTVAGTMGKTQKAIKNFKAAIIIDPGYATAKKNLNIALREAEKNN